MLNETDLSRIDLNLLVLFEAVMEERHVGRAASRMNLSPSAISHGLSRLRRQFDDPLFVRHARGVVPTVRAEALRQPVAEALAQLRAILAPPEAFDPARSQRRFMIGAPDGVLAVLAPLLLAQLRAAASSVRVGFQGVLPDAGEMEPFRAWGSSFAALDARSLDVAVLPLDPAPQRFYTEILYQEDFVIALRAGHALARGMTLDQYCVAEHLLVSRTGDPVGFVDQALAAHGRSRTVTATAPSFMLALAMVAESDMLAALPRRCVALHGARFGVVSLEPPLALDGFRLQAITPRGAMTDRGVAWLFGALRTAMR